MHRIPFRLLHRVLPLIGLLGGACGTSSDDSQSDVGTSAVETLVSPNGPALGDTALATPSMMSEEIAEPEPPPADDTCDPNYTPCVPIDSDVDCAGGRGNGPSYVDGPVEVIGEDVYHLDRDGDGIGCEN